jgi:hypothetical protein
MHAERRELDGRLPFRLQVDVLAMAEQVDRLHAFLASVQLGCVESLLDSPDA